MSTGVILVLLLLVLPLTFFLGGMLVKFGCYIAGEKMPGLVRASFYGLLASTLSSWIAPTLIRFVPFNDHVVPVVLSSIVLTVLIGGGVFKFVLGVPYMKGVVISLVHRSIGITTGVVALVAWMVMG